MFLFLQVELAERNGAIGVILFSDRQEKTSQNRNFTYPDSSWLPGKGTEYGHVGRLRGGDLLTPFYPAIGNITLVFNCYRTSLLLEARFGVH